MTVYDALKILSELLDEYQKKKRNAVEDKIYAYYEGHINALIEANKRILEKKSSQKD